MPSARALPKQPPSRMPANHEPLFELRLAVPQARGWQLEVWQLPSPATPRLQSPEIVATLKGTPLRLVETRVLKRLSRAGINLGTRTPGKHKAWPLDEDLALTLALLFRALAPMRNLDRIRRVADGIEAMSREEAGYWLGMSIHRKNPRRVLAALRMLMTAE